MKLVAFSIGNFRSIRTADKLKVGALTVLIGPNNEGKSNILRGLVVGMKVLQIFALSEIRGTVRPDIWQMIYREVDFNWERDYPVALQSKAAVSASTVIDLEFELSPAEIEAFRAEVGSALNGVLPIRIALARDGTTFEVKKPGRGAKALSDKRARVAKFIGARLDLRNIPSIRTAESSLDLVNDLVQRRLAAVERTQEYRDAVDVIAALQEPALREISQTVQAMLSTFLPDVKSVRVEAVDRYRALRRGAQVLVDDGALTPLQNKGDGVQSLAGISLIHHFAREAAQGTELVLAIEEPEAHLHPRAIHQLRSVLAEIASRQQVILTTHSPLLVNRADVGSNIIVDRKKARRARTISEIREVLGVRVADNLSAASTVLLCEGDDDARALRSLISAKSSVLSDALTSNTIAIDSMHGASNIIYKLSLLSDQLCEAHVFLDHDDAGRSGGERAELAGVLMPADRTFATVLGMRDSELEDLYDIGFYSPMIQARFGVSLMSKAFTSRRKKWTNRMESSFLSGGQTWNDRVCLQVKTAVSELVASSPDSALDGRLSSCIDALVVNLESKLMRQ